MSKLFFYYSAMNAGKSTNLLQASYNYKERGFTTALFTFDKDNRNYGVSQNSETEKNSTEHLPKNEVFISSRLGISEKAVGFNNETEFRDEVIEIINQNFSKDKNIRLGAIFVDEAQFLTEQQVKQLAWIVDHMDIPVLCYGLRTDFLGNVFEGSKWLLGWADELVEMKTICETGKKATFVLRLNQDGTPITKGEQILIGGNDKYISVSRKVHQETLNSGYLKIV